MIKISAILLVWISMLSNADKRETKVMLEFTESKKGEIERIQDMFAVKIPLSRCLNTKKGWGKCLGLSKEKTIKIKGEKDENNQDNIYKNLTAKDSPVDVVISFVSFLCPFSKEFILDKIDRGISDYGKRREIEFVLIFSPVSQEDFWALSLIDCITKKGIDPGTAWTLLSTLNIGELCSAEHEIISSQMNVLHFDAKLSEIFGVKRTPTFFFIKRKLKLVGYQPEYFKTLTDE